MATIVKTIGTAGRDYSTIAGWVAALPANLVTDGNSYQGNCYADSEFTSTGTLLTLSGHTTDATHTITLTTGAGQSFRDNANAQTNVLNYVAANGVALRMTSAGSGHTLNIADSNVFISNLQVQTDAAYSAALYAENGTTLTIRVDNCIFVNSAGASGNGTVQGNGGLTITNSLIVQKRSGAVRIIDGSSITGIGGPNLHFCTIVAPSDIATKPTNYLEYHYASGVVAQNCAFFGASGFSAGATTLSNCVTDIASPPSGVTGSKTYANQFPNTTLASGDFKQKTGSDLRGAGTSSAYGTIDIVQTPRPQAGNWDAGCWELLPSGPPTGTLAATDTRDTANIAGNVPVSPATGTLAATDLIDTAVFSYLYDPNTILLQHYDGDFTDSSGRNHGFNTVAIATSTAQKKFGSGSLFFGNTTSSQILNIYDAPDLRFQGDFTIDFWLYIVSNPASNIDILIKSGTSPTTLPYGPVGLTHGAGGIYLNMSSTGTSWDLVPGKFSGSFPTNEWHHIAFVRSGTTVNAYKDGVVSGFAVTVGTTQPVQSIDNIAIGAQGGVAVNSYLDEFRISNTARWTANFTPPTAPYGPSTDINGTLAATDLADTASLAGGIYASGTLAATEGTDTAAVAGGIYGTGTLAATDAIDTANIPGTVLSGLNGSFNLIEAADTAAFAGQVSGVAGVLSSIDAIDLSALSGRIEWWATLAAIDRVDTAAFACGVAWQGALSATDQTDTASVSGTAQWNATLAASDPVDTAIFSGAVFFAVTGSLAGTDAVDTASLPGTVLSGLNGGFNVPDPTDKAVIGGQVSGYGGVLSAIDAIDLSVLTGGMTWQAALAATDPADQAIIAGGIVATGVLAATDPIDTAAISSGIFADGTLAVTDPVDHASVSGRNEWLATLAANDDPDHAAFTAGLVVAGLLASVDPGDTAAIISGIVGTGALDATDRVDVAAFAGVVVAANSVAGIPGPIPDVPYDRQSYESADRLVVAGNGGSVARVVGSGGGGRVAGNGGSRRVVIVPPAKRAA